MLKHLLGAVCYWSGIDRMFYWLNRKAKRVVTFHNVLPDEVCNGMPRIPVAMKVSHFRWMIREATKFLCADADLDQAGTLTITFDDGYLNQYEVASKVLEEEGVAVAVIFVASDVLNAKGLDTALGVDRELHSGLKYSPEYERLRLSGMTLGQMDELRARGWKIGFHTKTHRRLSALTDGEKADELQPPAWLKDHIISYPFGWEKDVDERSVELVSGFGYEVAFSNQCERTDRISKFFRPRMVLMPDRYWIHFELSGAKYFFKHHRLLP